MSVQCTAMLSAHGRRWRCNRRAAQKYANQICGYCASMLPKKCYVVAFDNTQRHSAACKFTTAGCDLED